MRTKRKEAHAWSNGRRVELVELNYTDGQGCLVTSAYSPLWYECQGLGVTEGTNGGYAVTHLGSGLSVHGRLASINTARYFLTLLVSSCKVDWHKPFNELRDMEGLRKRVNEIYVALPAHYKLPLLKR